MKNTTSQPELNEQIAEALKKVKLADLDPRSSTFEDQVKREVARVREKADKAVKAAEDRVTAATELMHSTDFREAARTDGDLRASLARIALEAKEQQQNLHEQKAVLRTKPPATAAKPSTRRRTVKRP